MILTFLNIVMHVLWLKIWLIWWMFHFHMKKNRVPHCYWVEDSINAFRSCWCPSVTCPIPLCMWLDSLSITKWRRWTSPTIIVNLSFLSVLSVFALCVLKFCYVHTHLEKLCPCDDLTLLSLWPSLPHAW